MSQRSQNSVSLVLTRSEALVLFELLSRFNEDKSLTIEDPAESHTLHSLLGDLEKVLDEPFSGDYRNLLKQARLRVRNAE